MATIFDKTGIPLTATFDLQANIPLDSRFIVDTYQHLQDYLDNTTGCAYLGMQVFCEENDKLYILKGEHADKSTWYWEEAASKLASAEFIEVEIEDDYILINSNETEVNENDQLESDGMNVENGNLTE